MKKYIIFLFAILIMPLSACSIGYTPYFGFYGDGDEDDFIENLHQIPYVEKILVYGTEDDNECVSVLQALDCEKLVIVTIEGADHDFTGMVNEFIALIDLI